MTSRSSQRKRSGFPIAEPPRKWEVNAHFYLNNLLRGRNNNAEMLLNTVTYDGASIYAIGKSGHVYWAKKLRSDPGRHLIIKPQNFSDVFALLGTESEDQIHAESRRSLSMSEVFRKDKDKTGERSPNI